MPHPRLITSAHLISLSLCFLCFSGCTKSKKATEDNLNQLCLQIAKESYPSQELARLEQRFFSDKQSRGILKHEELLLGSYREVESSATLGVYELLYYMVNAQDQVVLLHNGPKTGGISLDQPNHISYVGECTIKWSHFKGSPLIKSFKLQAISPDLVAQKIKRSSLKDRAQMP